MSNDQEKIDKMAKALCEYYGTTACDSTNCECYRYCNIGADCSVLYNKGYSHERDIALAVLQEFIPTMYPSYDIFGNPTLVISREKFEAIRHRWLDKKVVELDCPFGGDASNDCVCCAYSPEYHFVRGECMRREDG